jgi:hypothetical protein
VWWCRTPQGGTVRHPPDGVKAAAAELAKLLRRPVALAARRPRARERRRRQATDRRRGAGRALRAMRATRSFHPGAVRR